VDTSTVHGGDFKDLKEGDHDTGLNHTVKSLIVKDDDFIVYLDEDYFVEWITGDNYDSKKGWPRNYSDVLNRVALLETKSEIFLSKKQIPSFRRLLGEAVATMLDSRDSNKAFSFLNEAEIFLGQRINQKAERKTVISSAIILMLISILGSILWNYQSEISNHTSKDIYDIINLSLYGALGAFLSVVARKKETELDPAAGLFMYCLDAFLRIFVGVIGAFFIIVTIKAKIISSTLIPSDNSWLVFVALSIVAGSSERLVPSIIKKIEDSSVNIKSEEPKPQNNKNNISQ